MTEVVQRLTNAERWQCCCTAGQLSVGKLSAPTTGTKKQYQKHPVCARTVAVLWREIEGLIGIAD